MSRADVRASPTVGRLVGTRVNPLLHQVAARVEQSRLGVDLVQVAHVLAHDVQHRHQRHRRRHAKCRADQHGALHQSCRNATVALVQIVKPISYKPAPRFIRSVPQKWVICFDPAHQAAMPHLTCGKGLHPETRIKANAPIYRMAPATKCRIQNVSNTLCVGCRFLRSATQTIRLAAQNSGSTNPNTTLCQ